MAKEKRMVSIYCSESGEPKIVLSGADALDLIAVYTKLTVGITRFIKEQAPDFTCEQARALAEYSGAIARAVVFGPARSNRRKTKLELRALALEMSDHIKNKEA